MNEHQTTLSLSIMSGKGGVGKTNIALNLAYALTAGGHSALLMDCDLGLANLDVLLGVVPEKNLEDLLDDSVTPEQVLVNLEPGRIDFLPSASGVPELVEWDQDVQTILFQKLNTCFEMYDFILLDLGAGINSTVIELASMTTVQCVVISPEPTSLTDGYALIKVLHTQKGHKDFQVIVNTARSEKQGQQTFHRLQAACKQFLNIEPVLLGTILEDPNLPKAVSSQTPLWKFAPNSQACKDIQNLSSSLLRLRSNSSFGSTRPLKIPYGNLK